MGRPEADNPKAGSQPIIALNVGGHSFATSSATLLREPYSMLSRLVESDIRSAVDTEGRVFIDRDPKYFRIILNYLRDGTCTLPGDESEIFELLREIDFYQLDGMRSFVLGEEVSHLSASFLRFSIINKIQGDTQLERVLDTVLEIAYGKSHLRQIPNKKARIEVSLIETASNAIGTASKVPDMHRPRDEQLYCYFMQDVTFQGKGARYDFMHKHEPALIYEEDYNAYDPMVYGGEYHERKHIKMMDVYRHHCIHSITGWQRLARETIVYIAENTECVQWGLEAQGYKDVRIHMRRKNLDNYNPDDTPPSSPRGDGPILCEVCFELHLSL